MPSVSGEPLFDQQKLRQQLAGLLEPHSFEFSYLDSCDSTNRQCMHGAEDGLIVISEHQTAGRGRRGKHWLSPQRQNLYCSIGLNKFLEPQYLGLISLLVGVSITDVLHHYGYSGVSLKWPNDILLDGKKLGGILIETRPKSSSEFYLVIGIGLNLSFNDDDLNQIDQPAIALNQVSDIECDQQQMIAHLLSGVFKSVRDFEAPQSEVLLHRFQRFDYLRDKPVLVKTLSEELQGQYVGVQADGQVCVRLAQSVKAFAAAEISIRESEPNAID